MLVAPVARVTALRHSPIVVASRRDGELQASKKVLSGVLEVVHGGISVLRAVQEGGFSTTCTCDVSIYHGGKADIKLHIASRKHQGYVSSRG